MKVLKGIFLSLLVFILFILTLFSSFSSTLKNTLLSGTFFSRTLDDSQVLSSVNSIIIDKITAMKPEGEYTEDGRLRSEEDVLTPPMGETIMKYLDKSWLEGQLPVLIKGAYSYFTSDGDRLPVINITPLKKGLLEGITDQVMEREETGKSMDGLDKIIEIMDRAYKSDDSISNEMIVEIVARDKEFKKAGIDLNTLEDLVSTYSDLKRSKASAAVTTRDIVREMLGKKVNIENMKDDLDLQLFMEKLYEGRDNPVLGVRNIITAYKQVFHSTLMMLQILILLIIAVVSFRPKNILFWAGGGLAAGGIAAAVPGLMGFIAPVLTERIKNLIGSSDALQAYDPSSLLIWAEMFTKGVFRNLFISGAIFAVTGIVFIVAGFFIPSHINEGFPFIKHAGYRKPLMISRILAVLLLFAAIPLIAFRGANTFISTVQDFKKAAQMQSQSGGFDISKALSEVAGIDFLQDLGKNDEDTGLNEP